MATQQLSAKRELLMEHLTIAQSYVKSLRSKKDLVDKHSSRLCHFVRENFSGLKQALDKKEKDFISAVVKEGSAVSTHLERAERSAKLIIDKSFQV